MGADYRMDAQQGKSCREAVYSNEYYDLIFDYISGYPRLESGCYQRVSDQYDIAYYARDQVPELNLQDYPYLTIPKCFGLSDLSALESSGILRLQNPEGLDLLGQGILVGFVDTGIDYTHPAFRNLDGSTRIAGIWDQTVEDGIPPEGFGYGQYFDEDSINRALQSEQPFGIVPSRDELGHGTFLARGGLRECRSCAGFFRRGAAGVCRHGEVQAGEALSAGVLCHPGVGSVLSGK